MKYNGKEYPLELTLEAFINISAMCEDNDIKNIDALISGEPDIFRRYENQLKIAAALNDAYVNRVKYETGDELPRLSEDLKPEAVKFLPFAFFNRLLNEITEALVNGERVTMEVEPPAPKNAAAAV